MRKEKWWQLNTDDGVGSIVHTEHLDGSLPQPGLEWMDHGSLMQPDAPCLP